MAGRDLPYTTVTPTDTLQCVVVSPDEANGSIRTVVIAPMTTGTHAYPTRIAVAFQGVGGQFVVDQLRTVDKSRLLKRMGLLAADEQLQVLAALQAFFAA